MTELTPEEIKIKSTLYKAVPTEILEVVDEILKNDPNNESAIYAKGLEECIMGEFANALDLWSKLDHFNMSLYNRSSMVDAVTRRFIRSFNLAKPGIGFGMNECVKMAVSKADEDYGLMIDVINRLDAKLYPDRKERFTVMSQNANKKYITNLADMVLASFVEFSSMKEQMKIMDKAREHILKFYEDLKIPMFQMMANFFEIIEGMMVQRMADCTPEQVAWLEDYWKKEGLTIVKHLAKARVIQSDRLSLFDAKNQRLPKDGYKALNIYFDEYFGALKKMGL